MVKDIRLEFKARNNRILRIMEEKGYETVAALCRAMGKPHLQSQIGPLIGMKRVARNPNGTWVKPALDLAEFFQCMPEDLFSNEQQEQALETNRASVEVSFGDVRGLLANRPGGHTPESITQARELRSAIEKVLQTLTPREERVVRLRFGIGIAEHTLDEVGEQLGVSKDRIRQIEEKALLKMKYPSRAKVLLKATGKQKVEGHYGEFEVVELDQPMLDALHVLE